MASCLLITDVGVPASELHHTAVSINAAVHDLVQQLYSASLSKYTVELCHSIGHGSLLM